MRENVFNAKKIKHFLHKVCKSKNCREREREGKREREKYILHIFLHINVKKKENKNIRQIYSPYIYLYVTLKGLTKAVCLYLAFINMFMCKYFFIKKIVLFKFL